MLHPEVRSDVSVGRCGIGAMHHLEGIVSAAGCHLRHQYYVAELQSCDAQTSVGRSHGLAGELTVGSYHFSVFFGTERCFHPAFVLLFGHQFGVTGFHKFIKSSLCIHAEYGSLCLDHFLQVLGIGREVFHPVTFFLHPQQQVVERGAYFHSACCQRILSGTFIVDDGYVLLAVGFCFQGKVVVHCAYERFQPFGNSK